MKHFSETSFLRAAALGALAVLVGAAPVAAQDSPSYADKTVTIIVGTTAGGSTDVSARLIAPFLGKYLPGKPTVVVQNRPGARGMTAMNLFAQQVAPDGLTAIIGSGSQIDPNNYRVSQSRYDPSKFAIVGGIGIGGSVLLIRNEALPRLTDKGATPVAMATISGMPRSGMQMAAWGAEYLGWNLKWVAGYSGNPDLILAFERGEADMTSVANTQLRPALLDRSKYTILYQSGSNAATTPASLGALAGVPLFAEAMKGKITDPLALKAFDYWRNISSINNWVALPPKTPDGIANAYRSAFRKTIADATFLAKARQMGEDVSVVSPEQMAAIVNALAELPPEAVVAMKQMLRRQGLNIEVTRKKKKS